MAGGMGGGMGEIGNVTGAFGSSGGMAPYGGFDSTAILAKISEIAPEFTPAPLLSALNNPEAMGALATPPAETNLAGQQQWDWMNPAGPASPQGQVPIPGDPKVLQQGPLQGVKLPPPPAATAAPGAAALTPEQMRMLTSMGNRPQPQQELRAPSGGVLRPGGSVQMSPLAVPQATRPPLGLAEILGLRR